MAGRLIRAPRAMVLSVLLDPLRLPEWNPALTSLAGPPHAAVGVRHPITMRRRLHGSFEYVQIEHARIDTTWQVPGFTERATWRLEDRGLDTYVTHESDRHGPLATLLHAGFRGVDELRLQRLADRAARSD